MVMGHISRTYKNSSVSRINAVEANERSKLWKSACLSHGVWPTGTGSNKMLKHVEVNTSWSSFRLNCIVGLGEKPRIGTSSLPVANFNMPTNVMVISSPLEEVNVLCSSEMQTMK
jgi:hypothetical protein